MRHLIYPPWFLLSEIQYPVKISYAQYQKYLKADNMIRTTAVCQVTDESEVVVARDVILDNPTLTLEVQRRGRVLPRTSHFTMSFRRQDCPPLPRQGLRTASA